MADAAKETETKKNSPPRPPNTAQLNKMLQESQAETAQQFEAVDLQLGELSNQMVNQFAEMQGQFGKILEAINAGAGRSAQNHPGGTKEFAGEEVNEENTDLGTLGQDDWDLDDVIDVVSEEELQEIKRVKMEALRFNNHRLNIIITSSADPQEKVFQAGVNGNQWLFRVGETYEGVPRYIVELLLGAKPWTYGNVETTNSAGEKIYENPITVGQRYGIQVTHDPAPPKMAETWLRICMNRKM